jgi:Lsr2
MNTPWHKNVSVPYVDDMTGEPIKDVKGGPVSFALEGTSYTIDLTDKNAKTLRDARCCGRESV